VVVDGVNSTGGIAIPRLLDALGVDVVELYCDPTGRFPHNPEPLKEHLGDICELVKKEKADFGIVVDPDVDRLVIRSQTYLLLAPFVILLKNMGALMRQLQ